VRLVGEDGKQIGVVKTAEALAYAQERDLDLVEVAPDARPPVCRVLDYSKYKYEQAQKQKAARKHQQQITVREIKFRPKIAQNDYDTKKGHVKRFLMGRDRVKVTIMFRGREVTHPERGTALLDRLAGELAEIAVVEQTPLQDGRNMTMMLAPSKAVLAGEKDDAPAVVPDKDGAPGAVKDEAPAAAKDDAPGHAKDDAPGAAAPATEEAAPAAAEETAPAAPEDPAPALPEDASPAADTSAGSADGDNGGTPRIEDGHQNGTTDSAPSAPPDAATESASPAPSDASA
jgi:translation initiation factor IF-3